MNQSLLIAPSLLSADAAMLAAEVNSVEQAGADLIHFDVMDHHYVPNLTFGPAVCQALKRHTSLPIDVHLMVHPVDALIDAFAHAGADWISFHPEASSHVHRSLSLIKNYGIKAGLALNPATPIHILQEVATMLDFVLIMSVNPGYGGQSFIPTSVDKIRRTRTHLDRHNAAQVMLEVDGGIHAGNIANVVEAGANIIVAGSAIFKYPNRQKAIQKLRQVSSMG